jgi:hypothetical protein
MPDFTNYQLRILLLALDSLQSEIAADLNGWTIGPPEGNDTALLCDNIVMDVEVDELRKTLQHTIH